MTSHHSRGCRWPQRGRCDVPALQEREPRLARGLRLRLRFDAAGHGLDAARMQGIDQRAQLAAAHIADR